jgi:predicted RNA binding protein YcfA (HicA-like mRNA interferase family)
MPPKIRELIRNLERAGFVNVGGRGSRRNFKHPNLSYRVTVSGNPGADANRYQLMEVQQAIKESRQ